MSLERLLRSVLPPRDGVTQCANCRDFEDRPAELERLMPGLATLSSALACVRARDGLCGRHERLVSAASHCAEFRAREVPRSTVSDAVDLGASPAPTAMSGGCAVDARRALDPFSRP